MATAAAPMTLKLLIDTSSKKVVFAEAGKDFVDFLFNILSLPLSNITRLLTKPCMVGSVGNIYKSVESLTEQNLQSTGATQSLLNPRATSASAVTDNKKFYKCPYNPYSYTSCNSNPSITDVYDTVCPRCGSRMTADAPYVGGRGVVKPVVPVGKGGYVKDGLTYMITDDLEVTPMSTISCISIINKFKTKTKEFGALEEKVVNLDRDERSKLLKVSLQSKTVLTSVFLGD